MPASQPTRPARSRLTAALAAIGAGAILVSAAAPVGAANPSGFRTSQAPMLEGVGGTTVTPLLTVGEALPGGYRFEAIPDGIAVRARGDGRLDVYVNHETSTVPFPYNAASPTIANSMNDFDNAQLSHLILNQHSAGVLHGSMAIASDENYQRFCSSFLATAEQGFDRELLFLNEEATDFVYRTGTAWPTTPGDPVADQAGLVVAYDVKSRERRPIPGMGRLNHENSVAIPDFDQLAVMTGDDTFVSHPENSQVYMYLADDADAVWNDQGSLWAFQGEAGYDSYYDFLPGSTTKITGKFVAIDRAAAIGNQAALESASDAAQAFEFIRIEDIAYDRNTPNVVYLADSGRASNALGSSTAPRPFASKNGRIWKMVLDPADPTNVLELSILIDGDTMNLGDLGAIHQPDNLETTKSSLLITEDPSTANKYPVGTGTTARIWRHALATGVTSVVARVDQSADEGPTDKDPASAPASWGEWESSGIVDVSSVFGPGSFLVDVQAHSLFVEIGDGPDLKTPAGPDWLNKREGGQLLLIRIPGA